MESAQNGTTALCVGMWSEEYQIYCKDYDRHNTLQWLCDSCKEKNKESPNVKCLSHGPR